MRGGGPARRPSAPGRARRCGRTSSGCAAGRRALWLLAALLAAASAQAQRDLPGQGDIEVTADEIEYERTRELYTATGRVEIRQGDRRIQAEWAAFSQRTQRGVASGNVRFSEGDERLQAQFVEFSVDTLRGLVFDASYDTGEDGFTIRAEQMMRVAEERYELDDGSFTTCRCPDPEARVPWRIRTRKADVEIGGYATARNTTFDILGVPAIWLPWSMFPVKSERETGLLFPEFAFGGNNGVEFGVPIFWAAADPLNVIITPRYLSKRGFKPDVELEYVLGERSGGRLFGTYVRDQEVEGDPDVTFSPNRWALLWEHDQYLPADWQARADVKVVSDNQYAFDFDELRRYRRDRFLESTVFGWNEYLADGSLGVVGALRFANDLQNPDDQDRDEVLLQRLPSLQAELLSNPVPRLGGLVGGMGIEFDYFAQLEDPLDYFGLPESSPVVQRGGFIDVGIDAVLNADEVGTPPDPHGDNVPGPEGNLRFDEGEPLLNPGSRMSFYPKLAYPVRLADRFELYPEVGYRQTLYGTDRGGFADRGLFTARVDLSTRLRGNVMGWRHTVEPILGWAYADATSQMGNPVFVPPTAVPQQRVRQLDLDNVVLDDADRIAKANRLRVGLGNRFTTASGRLGVELDLSAQYDFAREKFGWVIAEGEILSGLPVRSRFNIGYDPEENEIAEGLFDLSTVLPRRLGLIGARYRFLRRIPNFFEDFKRDPERFKEFDAGFQKIDQIDAYTVLRISDQWSLHYRATYSLESDLLLTNRGGIDYFSRCNCWAFGVEVSDDRSRGVQFRVRYSLLGLGRDSRSALYGSRGVGGADF